MFTGIILTAFVVVSGFEKQTVSRVSVTIITAKCLMCRALLQCSAYLLCSFTYLLLWLEECATRDGWTHLSGCWLRAHVYHDRWTHLFGIVMSVSLALCADLEMGIYWEMYEQNKQKW